MIWHYYCELSVITQTLLLSLQEKGKMPVNRYDIPKELWFLVDRLHKIGMEKYGLFTLSGLQNEMIEIREWLDTIPNTPIRKFKMKTILLLIYQAYMYIFIDIGAKSSSLFSQFLKYILTQIVMIFFF